MSIRQKKRRFVMRALVITLFMAVFSQFGQAQNVTNITETDKNSGNHPNTMIFNHFQVWKANDSSSKGMFQRSENSGKNIEGLRDTKTDIMFAKGFANYTNNGYSSAGTDRTAVANSTNATSVTYAMQVYNGSTGAIRGNQNVARSNYSCRNTTTYEGYYISSVSLTVSGGTLDGSTSGRSVVYFGSSAYANPYGSAPTGTATVASPASSGQSTLTWTNSDENVSYFILYNLKTSNTALSANANTSLKVVWTQKANATPTITASDANITYDATSGSIPVIISNPVTGGTLSATSSESWLTIGTVTTTSVPFTCSANPNNTQRSATVTITYTYSAKASVTQTVTVTQAGNPGAGCDNYEGFENCTAHTSTSVSGTSSGSTPTEYLPTDWKGYGASYYPFTANFNSYMGSLDGNFLFFKASTSNACFLALPYENVTEVTFDYAYETDAYNNQLHLEIGYMTDISSSTWYSNTFHSIKELTNNGATWDSETADFSSVSNTHYVVFKYSQSQGSWYSAAIDNVCVRAANSCPTPTDLNATNLTPNSATLSWTGEAESYNVRYRATSNGFSYNFESATPWAVDNFSPCTTYDGDGSGTGAIQDVDFENQNYTGSFIAFQNGITANAAAHGGNAFGACFYANPAPNNDYFILPAITIESGYVFKFWAKSFSSSYLESFRAGVYNGNGNLTTVLGSNTSVSNTWTEYSYNLSSYVGQTIQLAIHCNSNDCFAFFIDDIFVGDPNFNPTWSEPITGVTSPYILTGLDSDTEYEFQVQADCDTEGESAWSASASFTTLDGCAVPTDMNATNITASTATLSWTGFTDTYNIQYREYNPTAPATIILNVPSDIWDDGSGYQMLLDADATAIDNNSISDY